MNLALAILSWIVSWFLTNESGLSTIKSQYPEIPVIEEIRARFLLALSGTRPDSEALVAGLTIGIRDGISDLTAEQMRTLSLTHLVAVSGANLAIVLASTYFLLAVLGVGRNLRFLIGLAAMSGYVLLVGPESSVIRAATMAIFVMLGLWLGRGSSALNSLSLAVILLLAIDPQLARDFGFALSVFATAGLLLLAPTMFEYLRQRMPEFLALGIAASASAQLFTTPVLLLLQPSLPLYSVLANILVEPVVAPITILGILSVVAATASIPFASILSYLASVFSDWIIFIARWLSSWPEARIHFMQGPVGLLLVALIIVLLALSVSALKRHGSTLRVLAGTLAVFVLSVSAMDRIRYETFAGEWDLLACDVGQGDAVLIRSDGVTALIDVGPDPAKLARCLDVAGVQSIELLVLTHFDADHVGGIEGLSGVSIGQTLISGFEDDRPLVGKVERYLERAGVATTLGRAGIAGDFGEGSWKVLAPTATAIEASDSNDASVVVVFEFESWSYLGLGDLGEEGQLRLLRSSMPDLNRIRAKQLVLKVAHHGSADQSTDLLSYLKPDYSVFSVGKNNYGHPTEKALHASRWVGSQVLRTDKLGPMAIRFDDQAEIMLGGKLST